MKTIASTEAKTNFGALLDAAQREPVLIEKKGRGVAVLLAKEEYERLEEIILGDLRRELQIGLDDIKRGAVHDAKEVFDEILGRSPREP